MRKEPNPKIDTFLSWRESKFDYAFETSGLPMKLKRGCNQNCSYCVEPFIEGKRFSFRDIDGAIDELKHIFQTKKDTRNIFFVDTEFNLPDLSYCTQLVERVIKEDLHMRFGFSSQFLPKPFDDHLAELLAKAGFSIILTCDSFADEVLAQNNTSYRQKDIIRTLELCEDHGLGCTLSMIMGLPGETYETLDHSLEWINRYPPHFLRRYEYTFGGRIYLNTPLCKYIEERKCENFLYGNRSQGYITPYYYCSPESPMKLKEYVEKALGYSVSYENRYNEDSHRSLALAYLADQGKWEEVISGFSRCRLSSQLSIYEYLFRKLVIAEKQEEARRISENLLGVIPANNMDGQYDDYLNLIRFFLSQLG